MSAHPDQHFGDKSYSQHGEDLFIANLFSLLTVSRGRYLDIGAHHPLNISNTALLYSRGWNGVNVDANQTLINAFTDLRPNDTSVCCAVGAVPMPLAPFYKYDDLSGRNTMCAAEATTVQRTTELRITDQDNVPVRTIDSIVDEYCDGHWPEFLSVDIEGWDYEVLRSASFGVQRGHPAVICVETRKAYSGAIRSMLDSKGYKCLARFGENLIFIREFFHALVTT